ncbi:MAG: protein kinase [Deltaproteobacteria bacterium]|nr:protein kinase [Deltaproteobacteria bacterium]
MPADDVLDGRFRLDEPAGSGGMGDVWRGTDLATGARLAIKIIRQTQRDGLVRFQREAEALAVLAHPAIVGYVAHGPLDDGRWYVAMEWVDGVDLSERLREGPLTLRDALVVTRGIAGAIAAVHARGLVHRDLKPANVRLVAGHAEMPKLLDFGLARLEAVNADLTRTGALLGTAAYMSPEQARGSRDIDARSDLYALGCVLYECLAGQPPFVGDHVLATLAKVLLEPPPSVRELRPGLPRELEALVSRLLSKSPELRPRSAEEVLDALARIPEIEEGDPDAGHAARSQVARGTSTLSSSPGAGEARVVSLVLARRPSAATSKVLLEEGPTLDAPDAPESATSRAREPGAGGSAGPATDTWVDPIRTDVTPARPSSTSGVRDAVADELRRVVTPLGGAVEPIVGDCLLVVRHGSGHAADDARLTARCALGVRSVLPSAPIAIATGRADVSGRWPVGDVVERALVLLEGAASVAPAIAMDEVTAGLLDGRFEVGGGGDSGLLLFGERAAGERPRTLLGRPAPFVGRNRELATLHDLWIESREEPGARAVLVLGPEGIGKSRLRHELLARIRGEAASQAVEILEARADPARAGSPFALAAALLRSAAGVGASQSLDLQRQKLRARIARHLPDAVAPLRAPRPGSTPAWLLEIAGVGEGPDARADAQGRERDDPVVHAQRLTRAWVEWLRRETDTQSLVIVLEDLHWGDLPSVLLVDAALRDLRERPLYLAAFARPEATTTFPKLWEGRGLVRLDLRELGAKAARQLVEQVLGERATPELTHRIVERAHGNALHLEELVRAVAEGREDDVPPTLLAILESRLGQLDADARLVLRVASTFGTRFPPEGVRAVLGATAEAHHLDATLARLVEREVLSIAHDGGRRNHTLHAFRHALVRDVAYATLDEHDRVLCHRLVGGWLASRDAEPAEVAEHLEKGRDPEHAAVWYRRAAERAIRGQDHVRARHLAARALGLGAHGDDRAVALLALARAHDLGGKNADVLDAAELALSELDRFDPRWFEALELVTLASSRLGRPDRAIEAADLVEQHLTARPRETPVDPSAVQCTARVAMSMAILGDHARAARVLDAVTPAAEAIRDTAPVTWAWVMRATAWRADVVFDPSRCLTLAGLAAEGYLRGGDERSASDALVDACDALLRLGRYEEMVETAQRALDIARRLEIEQSVAGATGNLAVGRARLGFHDEAVALLRDAVHVTERQGYRRGTGSLLGHLAEVLLAMGRTREALDAASRAAEVLAKAPPLRAWVLATAAAASLALDEPERALERSTEAVAILDEIGVIETGEVLLLGVHADVLRAVGDHEGADRFAERARERAEELASAIADEESRRSFVTRVPEITRALRSRPR